MHSKRFSGFLKKTFFTLSLLFLFLNTQVVNAGDDVPTDDAAISAGEALFKQNCSSCHAVHEVVVGPALKDVTKRRNIAWLKDWVKNPAKVIASGDAYAKKLADEYKSAGVMSGFASLKDEEIVHIMAYVKKESSKPPVVVKKEDGGTGQGQKQDNGFVNLILVGLGVVLVFIIIVLGLILTILKKYILQKDDLTESDKYITNQKLDFSAVFKTVAFKLVLGVLFAGFMGKVTLDNLMSIGIQQGYAPTQPIPFSHKLHAGKHKIDCNYCHTGVRIGKQANIPSSNICMNCHSQIKKDSPKLAPLREAIATGKPIQWIRIHNLPDFAYFNHSQHVKVGGLECQQCHGPVEKMDVVQQFAPLTMGWCVNCHRETVVKAEGNTYYDKLLEAHKKGGKGALKVEDIGGLECSKCHY